MRLMLGTDNQPSLLVEVQQELSKDNFNFWVVNGAWSGQFQNGCISVFGCPSGDFSSLEPINILTENQDRLRGDYQDVFNNFYNIDYVAPKPTNFNLPSGWDDDIHF